MSARSRRFAPSRSVAALLAGTLALAAASLLVGWTLDYDPWSWLGWGRALWHDGTWDLVGGTAWKPLPGAVCIVLSLFGGAGPALWAIIGRAGGLLALGMGYRLAAREAGPPAGVLAVFALIAIDRAVELPGLGNSEGLLAALVLWAGDAHLRGREEGALALAWAATLIRPEVWPFWGVYAIVLLRRGTARRALVAGLALAIPLAWFVPQWIGTGNPLGGSKLALESPEAQLTQSDLLEQPWQQVLDRAEMMLPIQLAIVAALGLLLAARRRDRTIVVASVAVIAWVALVAVMAQAGYPGIARFLIPAAAVAAVLAAVALWRLVRLPPRRWMRVVAALAAAGLVALPTGLWIADRMVAQFDYLGDQDRAWRDEQAVIPAAGGKARLRRCGRPSTAAYRYSSIRWLLDEVPLVEPGPNDVLNLVFGSYRPKPARPVAHPPPLITRVHGWLVLAACDGDPRREARPTVLPHGGPG